MKLMMGLRLRKILARENFNLSSKYMFDIFMSGSFLNFALPGFLGGDGYVSYRLKTDKNITIKHSVKTQINSRANGLFGLCFAVYIFFMLSDFSKILPRAELLILTLLILQILVYTIIAKYYFKESLAQFLSIFAYSFFNQILAIILISTVLLAMNVETNFIEYFTVFFMGEVASMLPITPMGFGLRELIFFKGANQVGILPEKAIAVSIVLFAVFVATAIIGLIFYFKNNSKIEENKNGSA